VAYEDGRTGAWVQARVGRRTGGQKVQAQADGPNRAKIAPIACGEILTRIINTVMGKIIGESTADDLHFWIFVAVVYN